VETRMRGGLPRIDPTENDPQTRGQDIANHNFSGLMTKRLIIKD
jgi:hypothetical protein